MSAKKLANKVELINSMPQIWHTEVVYTQTCTQGRQSFFYYTLLDAVDVKAVIGSVADSTGKVLIAKARHRMTFKNPGNSIINVKYFKFFPRFSHRITDDPNTLVNTLCSNIADATFMTKSGALPHDLPTWAGQHYKSGKIHEVNLKPGGVKTVILKRKKPYLVDKSKMFDLAQTAASAALYVDQRGLTEYLGVILRGDIIEDATTHTNLSTGTPQLNILGEKVIHWRWTEDRSANSFAGSTLATGLTGRVMEYFQDVAAAEVDN